MKVGKSMLYAGIDVAKRNHEICMVNEAGDVALKMSVQNSQKGMDKFLQALKRLGAGPNNIKFCLEATGHYWLPIYCYLNKLGFRLHVINPIQSDALRNLYIRKTKTDQKDALLLADLLRFGRTPETELSPETVIKLQTLSRLRFGLVSQVSGLKNQILGILDRIFPEYEDCFSSVFVQTSKELLKEYPDPEKLAQVDLAELTAFLAKHSRGRLGPDRAQQIRSLAEGTFGINLALDAFTLELRLLLEQVEFIEEQIKIIEGAIDEIMEEFRPSEDTPYRHVIETIPGIGPVITAAIIGEVGDIKRFPNARALVAYSGLDATVKASGEFEGTRNRISKRGSPTLRHCLWLAAVAARRYNPELKDYYELKRSQGKHSSVATIAVARRLVHLIYSLWTDNRPFDPNYQWSPPRK
jgi:transposase